MFKHFIVKNFRGFAGLHLKDLDRINLIAGMNNTGKTALLEAIHLHNNPTDCQLPVTINETRGIKDSGKAVEDIVSWLFWGKQAASGLEASSYDDKGVNRTLTMWILDAETALLRFPEHGETLMQFRPDSVAAYLPRLVLRFEQSNESPRISIGVFSGTGVNAISVRLPGTTPSIFLPSGTPPWRREMQYFGELEAAKRQNEILPALQILEPRLQRLSLVPLSGEPVIHGDIGLPRWFQCHSWERASAGYWLLCWQSPMHRMAWY